jgi:hypothetical protein
MPAYSVAFDMIAATRSHFYPPHDQREIALMISSQLATVRGVLSVWDLCLPRK